MALGHHGAVSSTTSKDLRRDYEVPTAIGLCADAREVLAFLPGYEVAVREVAAHPGALPKSELGGRRRLARLEMPGGSLLVREYGKGGLLRRVRGPAMHGRLRPLDELVLHRRLAALGVAVADAVASVVLRGAFGWRGYLLLEEVQGASDLEAWLYGASAPARLPRTQVLLTAGQSVRRLHDAGVAHPDLHPKNLLLTPAGEVLVLDLDKARPAAGRLSDAARLQNLVRLGRAIEKHRLKGLRASPRDALRFLEGYAGSRAAARAWYTGIRSRLRRGLRLRVLWWRLLGEARPWQGAAAGSA